MLYVVVRRHASVIKRIPQLSCGITSRTCDSHVANVVLSLSTLTSQRQIGGSRSWSWGQGRGAEGANGSEAWGGSISLSTERGVWVGGSAPPEKIFFGILGSKWRIFVHSCC